jgi:hypothetical protein
MTSSGLLFVFVCGFGFTVVKGNPLLQPGQSCLLVSNANPVSGSHQQGWQIRCALEPCCRKQASGTKESLLDTDLSHMQQCVVSFSDPLPTVFTKDLEDL